MLRGRKFLTFSSCFYTFVMSLFPVCLSFEQCWLIRLGSTNDFHPELKSSGIYTDRDINLNYAFIDNVSLTKSVGDFSLKGKKADRCVERRWSSVLSGGHENVYEEKLCIYIPMKLLKNMEAWLVLVLPLGKLEDK